MDAISPQIYISGALRGNQKIEGHRFIYIINWPLLWYCHMSNNTVNMDSTFSIHFWLTLYYDIDTLSHFFLIVEFFMQFQNKTLYSMVWFVTTYICPFTLNICIICLIYCQIFWHENAMVAKKYKSIFLTKNVRYKDNDLYDAHQYLVRII